MRRHVTIRIEGEGRDKGKVFIVTEMPATLAEEWAFQVLSLLAESGVELPNAPAKAEDDAETGQPGMESLAAAVVDPKVSVQFLKVLHHPSLSGWWDCVQYQHAKEQLPQAIVRDPAEACQIEEIATITRLRMEVLRMHTGFFSPAGASTSGSPSPAVTHTGSSPTRMSRPRSAP